jgi:cellulose synthase operon protein YhjU
MRLSNWNLFFLLQIGLYWVGAISLSVWLNVALIAAIAVSARIQRWEPLRTGILVLLAALLLYHESWLPDLGLLAVKFNQVMHFDREYIIELAARVVDVKIVLLVFAAWIAYRVACWYIRMDVIVLAAFLATGVASILQSSGDAVAVQNTKLTKDQALDAFYVAEKNRTVDFAKHAASASYPDIVFLHICSLSWDDMKASGLDSHPIWRKFDFMFTHFNSVSTYSGPAVIRLLRGGCGQQPSDDLYAPTGSQCMLFPKLAASGYKTAIAMNHDGHYDDFLPTIARNGLSSQPVGLNGLRPVQHSFDGSPIYDDLQALNAWNAQRDQTAKAPEALFYNSISLHDGNVVDGRGQFSTELASYQYRAKKLLDDMLKFIVELEAAKRPTILVLVPEHGAAVRGDAMQFSGLREIPSPAITLVPVGIKYIGVSGWEGRTAFIDQETSYLDLTALVSSLHELDPADLGQLAPQAFLRDLSSTPFVSENEGITMFKNGDGYFWKRKGADWNTYACQDRCAGGSR